MNIHLDDMSHHSLPTFSTEYPPQHPKPIITVHETEFDLERASLPPAPIPFPSLNASTTSPNTAPACLRRMTPRNWFFLLTCSLSIVARFSIWFFGFRGGFDSASKDAYNLALVGWTSVSECLPIEGFVVMILSMRLPARDQARQDAVCGMMFFGVMLLWVVNMAAVLGRYIYVKWECIGCVWMDG